MKGKQELLALLRKDPAEGRSPTDASGRIGVPRAGLSRLVRALRKDGHTIEWERGGVIRLVEEAKG